MAKDSLMVAISPALREAMGIRTASGTVDYFQLLGVEREIQTVEPIDHGIMDRSRVLRKWQNSPQYGQEVVKLLPMLHRIGKILKDTNRRQAYREQVERMERGEAGNVLEEFVELVRAAMADNLLDANSRQELTRFASARGLSAADAQRIVAQVREEMKASKTAQAEEPKDDGWEFRIAEQGEEGFSLMLAGLENSGKFSEDTPAQLIAQAAKYQITAERAAQIIAEFQKYRFQRMIKRVAGGGVLSEAQIRLLLPKASVYGLDNRQAYEIIADYTLSAQSTDDALRNLVLAETFNNEEIATIVNDKAGAVKRRARTGLIPDWLRNVILIVLGVVLVVVGALWVQTNVLSQKQNGIIAPPDSVNNKSVSSPANYQPPYIPPSAREVPLVQKADPPSRVLAFRPEEPNDPPAFEMAITEVTCQQYQEFLKDTLEAPPTGWSDGHCPSGAEQMPVTNIQWRKAMGYCKWLATQKGWPASSVRLPTHAEFLRVARGRTTRGSPLKTSHFWSRAKLDQAGKLMPVRANQLDEIFLGGGQIYDLIGNAAEWGSEESNGQHLLLGGDYAQTAPDFNPLEKRWVPADTLSPTIGFRFVHALAQ